MLNSLATAFENDERSRMTVCTAKKTYCKYNIKTLSLVGGWCSGTWVKDNSNPVVVCKKISNFFIVWNFCCTVSYLVDSISGVFIIDDWLSVNYRFSEAVNYIFSLKRFTLCKFLCCIISYLVKLKSLIRKTVWHSSSKRWITIVQLSSNELMFVNICNT